MAFFTQAVNVLKILVMAVGAGLGAWGIIRWHRTIKRDLGRYQRQTRQRQVAA